MCAIQQIILKQQQQRKNNIMLEWSGHYWNVSTDLIATSTIEQH